MLRQARGRAGAPVVRGDAASLPFADAAFEAVVTTFAFSAFPDGDAAMSELARVLAPGGQLALVDAGLPRDGNALGSGIAGLWERFGDFMRDDAALMTEAGLVVETYRELGAFGSVHLTVGRKRLATPG
jgi:ubiquinone/menaquinone biosynthesis C-methylase UbiE